MAIGGGDRLNELEREAQAYLDAAVPIPLQLLTQIHEERIRLAGPQPGGGMLAGPRPKPFRFGGGGTTGAVRDINLADQIGEAPRMESPPPPPPSEFVLDAQRISGDTAQDIQPAAEWTRPESAHAPPSIRPPGVEQRDPEWVEAVYRDQPWIVRPPGVEKGDPAWFDAIYRQPANEFNRREDAMRPDREAVLVPPPVAPDLPQLPLSSGAQILSTGLNGDNPTYSLVPSQPPQDFPTTHAPPHRDVYGGPIDVGLILDPAIGPQLSYVTDNSKFEDIEANSRKLIGPCGGKWIPTPNELEAQGYDVSEVAKEVAGYRMFASEREAKYHRLHTVSDSLDATLSAQASRSGALGDADWSQNPITRSEIGKLAGNIAQNRDILSQLEGVKIGILQDSDRSTSLVGMARSARLQDEITQSRTSQWNASTDAALYGASLEQLVDLATGGQYDIDPEQAQGMSARAKEQLAAGLRRTIKQALIERQRTQQQAAEGGMLMLPPRIVEALENLQRPPPPPPPEPADEPPTQLPPRPRPRRRGHFSRPDAPRYAEGDGRPDPGLGAATAARRGGLVF